VEKNIIIFDLDGTLADIEHRLHFINGEEKNWSGFFNACDGDSVIEDTANILDNFLYRSDLVIGIVSGRSDEVEEKTRAWLSAKDIYCDFLVMRKAGDYRPDHVIKKEWLDGFDGKDHILAVFEDRKAVVDMWREAGLTCYQVAEGDF